MIGITGNRSLDLLLSSHLKLNGCPLKDVVIPRPKEILGRETPAMAQAYFDARTAWDRYFVMLADEAIK